MTEAWGFSYFPDHEETYLDGLLLGRGYVEHQEIAWSDLRLPPTHWTRMDYVIQGTDESDAVVTIASSHLLLGEEGNWRGTGRALEWDDEGFQHVPFPVEPSSRPDEGSG